MFYYIIIIMIKQLIILLLIIFFIILFIALFIKLTYPIDQDIREYDIIKTGNGRNMKLCPKGCIRGTCNLNTNNTDQNNINKNNNCKYDFQCQYCQDTKTNNFYVSANMNHEKNILPVYKEEKHMILTQKDLLNDEIKKNNEYIININKHIQKINS